MNEKKKFRYFDKTGREVKEGDRIRFTLYDGLSNVEFVVRKDKKWMSLELRDCIHRL